MEPAKDHLVITQNALLKYFGVAVIKFIAAQKIRRFIVLMAKEIF
jgi:hypothetical protein